MTKQEAFTLMVQHLRTQAIPSVISHDEGGVNCLYRHPDGIRRCAVGVLIPDKDYSTDLEGKGVGGLLIDHPHLAWLAPLNHRGMDGPFGMLHQMQNLHDSVVNQGNIETNFLDHWEQGFTNIARAHGLIVPEHPCKDTVTAEVAVAQAETITV